MRTFPDVDRLFGLIIRAREDNRTGVGRDYGVTEIWDDCVDTSQRTIFHYPIETPEELRGTIENAFGIMSARPSIVRFLNALQVFALLDQIDRLDVNGGFEPSETGKLRILVDWSECVGDLLYAPVLVCCTDYPAGAYPPEMGAKECLYLDEEAYLALVDFEDHFCLENARKIEPVLRALPGNVLRFDYSISSMPNNPLLLQDLDYVLQELHKSDNV